MEVVELTAEEYAQETAGLLRRSRGKNIELVKRAEKQPLRITFDSGTNIHSKITSFYGIRRKLKAQVAILHRGNAILMGPGQYTTRKRRSRTTPQ